MHRPLVVAASLGLAIAAGCGWNDDNRAPIVDGGDVFTEGTAGGPFAPSSVSYDFWSYTNYIPWTISHSAAWISLSDTSGTFEPFETEHVTAFVNALANALPPGNYVDTIVFEGLGDETRRTIHLTVRPTLSLEGDGRTAPIGPAGVLRVADGRSRYERTVPEEEHLGAQTDVVALGACLPTCFVSAEGDDADDGLSPDTPFRSIQRALTALRGAGRVCLRRGDTWTVSRAWSPPTAITFGAYGRGEHPQLHVDPVELSGNARVDGVRIGAESGP